MKKSKLLVVFLMCLVLGVGCGVITNSEDSDSSREASEDNDKESSKDSDKKSKNKDVDMDEWMTEVAKDHIDKLQELASDDNCIMAIVGSDSIVELITEWAEADIDEDEEVVVALMDKDTAITFMKLQGYDEELSDVAKEYLGTRVCAGAGNMAVASLGSNYLAASSVLNYGKAYIAPGEIEDQMWIIPTDMEGLAITVSFVNSGDGVISVGANYMPYADEGDLKKSVKSGFMMFKLEKKEIDW